EDAIALNGVSVQMNSHAFRAGRLFVVDPAWAKSLSRRRLGAVEVQPTLTREMLSLVEGVSATGELRRLLEIRVSELCTYASAPYAREYVEFVKRVRGTGLDPFGYAEVRRVERALPGEYRALVEKALVSLSPETYERAVKLACLPDVIRGYEAIKLRNVRRFRDEVRALGF